MAEIALAVPPLAAGASPITTMASAATAAMAPHRDDLHRFLSAARLGATAAAAQTACSTRPLHVLRLGSGRIDTTGHFFLHRCRLGAVRGLGRCDTLRQPFC